jgi:pimeloyl-ACP methyl ester carboxylesterase
MLGRVRAPTLLLVGAGDEPVLRANRKAAPDIAAEVALVIIPGATHFEEPGAPAEAATRAARWFLRHLVEIGAPARV